MNLKEMECVKFEKKLEKNKLFDKHSYGTEFVFIVKLKVSAKKVRTTSFHVEPTKVL